MDLKLEIFKDTTPRSTSKALLMEDGKLYFNKSAVKEFDLSNEIWVNMASNEEDSTDKSIYLILCNRDDEYALKINKSGYFNSKNFFRKLKINPKEKPYYYTIEESTYGEKKMLVLTFAGERKRKSWGKKEVKEDNQNETNINSEN